MRSKDGKELHCRPDPRIVSLETQHPINLSSDRSYVLLPRGVICNHNPKILFRFNHLGQVHLNCQYVVGLCVF